MKKHLLLLLSLLLTTTMLFAERVSQSDAATVASNFLNGAVTSTKKSKAVTPNRMTLKTAAAASESQFYVYENPDGGWVMVSADDVANPVLAYSKTGSFNFEKMPTNVKAWLKSYENDIKTASEAGLQADEETAAKWDNLKKGLHKVGTPVVSNLIKTKWDQDGVYNSKCPYDETAQENTATGCVATAMAQIMNYWQWPINGVGSHTYEPEVCLDDYCNQTKKVYPQQSVNFAQTTYDWANMLDYYYDCKVANGSVSCTEVNYTTAQGDAISTLMWHCGVAVDMMYDISDNGGSAAYTLGTSEPSAELALQTYFNYKPTLQGVEKSNYGDTQWKNLLKAELDANRPMIYAGGAHCFICDGYDDSDYFRFNWGWSGIDDGYYLLTALTPTTMYGTGGSDYNFTEGQEAIIGIVPNRSDLYILGEVEANDYTWDPSKGAKMNFANNVFTLTTRIQGTGGYGYLSFTTALASGSSAWDEIASSRLGADASDKLVSSGSMYSLTTDYNNAFKFPNGLWTITVDLENKTMTAVKPTTYTVTWNNSGTEKQVEFVKDAALELPVAPSACDNGKVFVGWTEATSVNADVAPEDLFTKAGTKTVTKNITYNAVFATATSGGNGAGWELVTDASTLKEGDVLVIASNSKGKTAGAISNNIMAEVESTFEGTDLQSLGDGTVELTLGGSEGAWTLTSSEGSLGATAVKKVAWGSGTTTWSISISDNNATIQNGTEAYGRFLHNVGSNRFTTYTSNTTTAMLLPQLYRKAGGYADYSLGCGTITPVSTEWTITLVDVPEDWGSTINLYAWDNDLNPLNGEWPGTAMTANRGTTYTATLTVYGSNPVANIIFNDGTNQTVDIEGITGPGRFRVNSTKEGAKYTANEVYKVTVNEATRGSLSGLDTWYAENATVSFTVVVDDNYEFSGVTVKDADNNNVDVTENSFTMPAKDVTITPAFTSTSAATEGEASFIFNTDEGLTALGITKPANNSGTNLGTDPYTSGSITMTATDGSTATRVWAANNTGVLDLRIYKNGTLTFSGATITKIVLAGSAVNVFSVTDGSFASGTWEGSASEVVLTATGTGKINTITVTYSGGGSVDPEEVILTPTQAQAWYYADYSSEGSHNWVMNFADGDFDEASWTFNMQIEVNTAEANALAGSYDENNGVVIGLPDETHTVLMNGLTTIEGKEVSLKLTYNLKDAAGNPTYDVEISFLGDDGKRYKINKEALAIIAKDVDSDEVIDLYGDTGTPLTKYDIVYYTCGEQYTTQSYYDGDTLLFPSIIPPAQNGKAFVGWTTTEHHTSATAPTFVEEGTEVHASANYHAVYK